MGRKKTSLDNDQLKSTVDSAYITTVHNAAAANFPEVWLNFNLEIPKANFFGIIGNGLSQGITTENGIFLTFSPQDQKQSDITITHDASASTNGTQMYLRFSDNGWKIVSDTAANADSYFQDDDNNEFPVMYDPDASAGIVFGYDDSGDVFNYPDTAFDHGTIYVESTTGKRLAVVRQSGPTSLYFKDSTNEILGVMSDTTDHTTQTVTTGLLAAYGTPSTQVYIDEDADEEDRFQHASATVAEDVEVFSNFHNRLITVKRNPNAAVDGVPVYFHSGLNKTVFVSPTTTNAQTYYSTDFIPNTPTKSA